MECCYMNIKSLLQLEDEDICEDCFERVENHIEDMVLNQAVEDYYDRKYNNDQD